MRKKPKSSSSPVPRASASTSRGAGRRRSSRSSERAPIGTREAVGGATSTPTRASSGANADEPSETMVIGGAPVPRANDFLRPSPYPPPPETRARVAKGARLAAMSEEEHRIFEEKEFDEAMEALTKEFNDFTREFPFPMILKIPSFRGRPPMMFTYP